MQAKEQYRSVCKQLNLRIREALRVCGYMHVYIFHFRAAKERKKSDRVVFECQERAYWVVHRAPVRTHAGPHLSNYLHL